ncbi:MAG: DUF1385 domain-containing protein [Anaerolineae bacterium]|nr:DUF1385 domain-containing protein [Anaerolineae bacterium]
MVSRVVLLPVLIMVAYEYMRFVANHLDIRFIRWLSFPGMAMQKLTTNEPDLKVLEVAITAFKTMYDLENPKKNEG